MALVTLLFLGLSSGRQILERRQKPAYELCPAQTRTGYLQNTAGEYLTCTNESCKWQAFSDTATQLFRQVVDGKKRRHPRKGRPDQESQFQIYSPSGAPTGMCLNYFEQSASDGGRRRFGGTASIRMAACNIKGSRKWNLCKGFLGFDRMRNCVQSNADLAECKTSHAVVTLQSPKCVITSSTIDKITCLSPVTGGGCAATGFDAGTVRGAASQSDCDACRAAPGSSQQCSFSFAYTTSQTITQSWSHSDTWSIGLSFSVSENFIFGSATEGLSFSFSQTLTKGHSKTISSTTTDTTGCAVTLDPGTREKATGTYLVGTIHADFNATVTRHYSCNTGTSKHKSYVKTMSLMIDNVPTQRLVGSCTTISKGCPTKTPTLALA